MSDIRCLRFLLEEWTYEQATHQPSEGPAENCGVTVYESSTLTIDGVIHLMTTGNVGGNRLIQDDSWGTGTHL
jgi:hypothetical protein